MGLSTEAWMRENDPVAWEQCYQAGRFTKTVPKGYRRGERMVWPPCPAFQGTGAYCDICRYTEAMHR